MSIDAQILNALRAETDGAVSGAELSEKLGVSRAAIWARIEELRSLGYDIEATPHLGYQLVSAPDVLHADDLLSRLGKPSVIGRDIRVFHETTSTNDIVDKLARDGVKEGLPHRGGRSVACRYGRRSLSGNSRRATAAGSPKAANQIRRNFRSLCSMPPLTLAPAGTPRRNANETALSPAARAGAVLPTRPAARRPAPAAGPA